MPAHVAGDAEFAPADSAIFLAPVAPLGATGRSNYAARQICGDVMPCKSRRDIADVYSCGEEKGTQRYANEMTGKIRSVKALEQMARAFAG